MGVLGAVLVGAPLVAGGASTAAVAATAPLRVVAGENFWGSVAAQLGGRYIQVTSILTNPNVDPHLYESTASNAFAVAEARLVIENGGGYDDWLSQLLGATRHRGRLVVDVQDVLGMKGPDVNPHFWYDVPRVPKVAAAIEAALVKLDPGRKRAFASNLAAFDRSLRPIAAVIAQVRKRYPGAPVAYTERLPGYLLQAAGLKVMTPSGFAMAVEDGNDPSPADSLAMDRLLTNHKVKVLVYNEQVVSAVTDHVEALARSKGVPVVAVSETMPPSYQNYQAWQLAQAKALLRALGSKRP